ncbi:MAG: isocitrate/isopropylmalate dehydrogenase family protein [Rhodospirillales bacterium]
MAGDGIGPEVTRPTVALLRALAATEDFDFDFTDHPAGAQHYRDTGVALPESTYAAVRDADATLLGAMGLPDIRYPDGTEIAPQIELRIRLGLYAGVRPVLITAPSLSPLRIARDSPIDFVIVRESTEGLFASHGRGVVTEDREASESLRITRRTSEKLFDFAFDLARKRKAQGKGPGLVHCIDKANVFLAFAFFRKVFQERASAFPDIAAEAAYVDAAALWMVQRPQIFDVMVTENMFGDILSDLGAGLMGGLGLAPSADIGEGRAVFQPCHGTAPDIAGRGIANPVAMVLSAAMMLDWLGETSGLASLSAAAARLEAAVAAVLDAGTVRTADMGGSDGTDGMVGAIADAYGLGPAR